MNNICILNYGSGNVRSVFNMLQTITEDVIISNKPEDIHSSSHIILPGVGAFGASMEKIKEKIPLAVLEEEVLTKKKPFLGICVGMQVLANKGYEFGEFEGLGWIEGETVKLDSKDLPLPHIGWNNIEIVSESPLINQFDNNQDFYFVHSFIFQPTNKQQIIATTNYGDDFCSIIGKDNIFGVQFHPEKSQKAGKKLLENFLTIK